MCTATRRPPNTAAPVPVATARSAAASSPGAEAVLDDAVVAGGAAVQGCVGATATGRSLVLRIPRLKLEVGLRRRRRALDLAAAASKTTATALRATSASRRASRWFQGAKDIKQVDAHRPWRWSSSGVRRVDQASTRWRTSERDHLTWPRGHVGRLLSVHHQGSAPQRFIVRAFGGHGADDEALRGGALVIERIAAHQSPRGPSIHVDVLGRRDLDRRGSAPSATGVSRSSASPARMSFMLRIYCDARPWSTLPGVPGNAVLRCGPRPGRAPRRSCRRRPALRLQRLVDAQHGEQAPPWRLFQRALTA